MDWDTSDFSKRFVETVQLLDKGVTAALCKELIDHLRRRPTPYPEKEAKRILQTLRNKRFFDLMQKVADAFIQSGQTSPQIRRQYAQALLDLNHLTAAINVLERLVAETAQDLVENVEARGLIGRAYKQLYVDANEPALERNQQNLGRAVRAYHEVNCLDPAQYLWHGINTVTLLKRALRDGVGLPDFPACDKMAAETAEKILGAIHELDMDGKAGTWDFATAVEACVALSRSEEAMKWLARYIAAPYTDAFELASTLRQLTEVCQLDMKSELGQGLLPALRAELLKREGGGVEISASDLRAENLERSTADGKFEKVFGADSYVNFEWYQTGIERCRAVARVSKEMGEGFGTGFLVNGADLHASLGEELMLLTNSHVVSDDPKVLGALRPDEAFISFEALSLNNYLVKEVVWTSPPTELDATLIRLNRPAPIVQQYPIAQRLPNPDGKQRIYVVGHPKGGKLSFSLHDNLLLDHQAPRIHYRTPTEGGSSGSPVFNQQWRLIGLHHMGDAQMPKLNGQAGSYEANEGIWIGAIKEAIAKKLAEQG